MYTPLCPGTTSLVYDNESLELLVVSGNVSSGDYTVLGPVRVGATVQGDGVPVLVSPDGALKVADWGAHPIMGSDATGANTYANVVIAPYRCRYLHATCATNGAVISIDGGKTDAFAIPAAAERLFEGLDIAPGAIVMGRNLTAGSNYTGLYVSVW